LPSPAKTNLPQSSSPLPAYERVARDRRVCKFADRLYDRTGRLRSGPRYAQGNLKATPLVDNGMMYIRDGWGSVYAIDVSSEKAVIK
jgi:hypothetical protein